MTSLARFIAARQALDRLKEERRLYCELASEYSVIDDAPGEPPCWYREHDEPPATEAEMCGSCITRQRARKALPNARRREARAFARLAEGATHG